MRGHGPGLLGHVVECCRQFLDFHGGEFTCLEFFCALGDILGGIEGILGRHMGDLWLFVRGWAVTFALMYLP